MMMRSAIAAAVFGAIAGSGLAGDVLVAMAQTSSSAAPSWGSTSAGSRRSGAVVATHRSRPAPIFARKMTRSITD
jgi:hypothetical protein